MRHLWVSEHFKPEEVLSPDGLKQLSQGNLMLQPLFLRWLDEFRRTVGRPVLINYGGLQLRGYRSPHENMGIPNSAKYSRHVQGIAADITVRGISSSELADMAQRFGFTGIGVYENFVHIDMRAALTVIRWGD